MTLGEMRYLKHPLALAREGTPQYDDRLGLAQLLLNLPPEILARQQPTVEPDGIAVKLDHAGEMLGGAAALALVADENPGHRCDLTRGEK
jgi:hypothetical protein